MSFEQGLLFGLPVALGILGIGALIKYTSKHNKEVSEEETKDLRPMEAHTDTGQSQLVNNWGTLPVIGTDRGLMGGQAVGQNVNYNYPVGQQGNNGEDTVRSDWTAYSYTLMTTEPIFGSNYFGRAIGAN
jgi:hypothetical protein|tara:strand:- start:9858 stop:10247 length:390 start_codon:yes stop_codon:yes gene_type:complete